MQLSLFDLGCEQFKITKPIRLIELFAGYGSQHLALKYLGVKAESYKICEWAVKSIQAYKDMHFANDNEDYSRHLDYKQVVDYLKQKGISADYNKPMTEQQIMRLRSKARIVYNNIIATHNLVNIEQVHSQDLEIVEPDKYCYIMTYSFPCQDLSKAGLGKGMEKGCGTRSGMLWEVERILDEISRGGGYLPTVLIMENVPDVIGANNIKHFASWLAKLETLKYKCYWKVLNAKEFGVPQNRERCFMVSIHENAYYDFPEGKKLDIKLKDLLEDDVDEKYYLSQKMLKYCTDMTNRNGFVRGERFKPIDADKQDYAYTVTTAAGQRPTDNFIKVKGKKCPITKDCENYIQWKQEGFLDMDSRAWKDDKVAPTIHTNSSKIKILEKQKQDYIGTYQYQSSDKFMQGRERFKPDKEVSDTLQTIQKEGVVYSDYRIRKLTPKECFRLMGVKDEDFEKVAKNQSNASLYHLAGDSIVVDVLMAIFKKML